MTRFLRSFGHAFEGLVEAARTQPNFAIHLVITVGVMLAAVALHLAAWAFIVVVLVIVLVLGLELANTALEALVDLVSPQHNPLAKRAKDTAAGAVLVASGGAVLVAVGVLAAALRGEAQGGTAFARIETWLAAAIVAVTLIVLGKARWPAVRGLASVGWAVVACLLSVLLCAVAHDPRVL